MARNLRIFQFLVLASIICTAFFLLFLTTSGLSLQVRNYLLMIPAFCAVGDKPRRTGGSFTSEKPQLENLQVRNYSISIPELCSFEDEPRRTGGSKCGAYITCNNRRTLSYSDKSYFLDTSEPLPLAIESLNNLLECLLQNRTRLLSQFEAPWTPLTRLEAVSQCLGCSLIKLPPCHSSTANKTDKTETRYAIGGDEKVKLPNHFFDILELEPRVLTVYLNWSASEPKEPPMDRYYSIRRTYECCGQIAATHNSNGCDKNLTVYGDAKKGSIKSSNDQTVPFRCNAKLPDTYFGSLGGCKYPPVFLHIIRQGTINKVGNVRVGNTYIVAFQCQKHKHIKMSGSPNGLKELKEVFVIDQFWGDAFFHVNIEDFPRLMPYLSFLKKHPEIWIHAQGNHILRLLPLVGLSPQRVVSGEVQAEIIYLPQGGGCGRLHAVAGRLLHQKYAEYIQANFYRDDYRIEGKHSKGSLSDTTNKLISSESLPNSSPDNPNSIVLIQRSQRRWLAQHGEVKKLLEGIARDNNMVVEVFSDKPVPSLNATMVMFSRAKLVVAPHGAGLSNTLFSRPDTKVVEILCPNAPVFCYAHSVSVLDQFYVGIMSLKKKACGPMFVNLDYLKYVVLSLLT